MESRLNHNRALRQIKNWIDELNLNLNGKTVLTEVGSNAYIYTPIIALLAGADKVIAYTGNRSYCDVDELKIDLRIILNSDSQLDSSRLIIRVDEFTSDDFAEADIITNSGFLRPLDQTKLQYVKNGAVVTLMYEKWELRTSDIDIEFCKQHAIKVAGTWENHPSIRVFDFIGPLAVKMAFEAGYEVMGNNIVVWSDDDFGDQVEHGFREMDAKYVTKTTSAEELMRNIETLDFIFLCDYSEQRSFSSNEVFDWNSILKVNPSVGIVHLYGKLEMTELKERNVIVYPQIDGKSSRMSKTLSYIGIEPTIRLLTAGFKVGEYLGLNKESEDILQLF